MNAINIEVGQTLSARLREAISLSNPIAVSIWYDSLADDVSEKNTGVTFNGTTDIILVGAPLQSVPVVVTEITIVNNDSIPHTFDWFIDDGGTELALPAFSLEAGQAWYMSSAESTHAVVEADPVFSLWQATYAVGEGAKTATEAGTVTQMSVTDDYLYICVLTGGAGAAKWKRVPLFAIT